MRVKDARGSLHNGNCLIEGLELINPSLLTRNHRDKIELQILWVQICDEIVWQACLFTGRYLKIVSCARQVPHYRSPRWQFGIQWQRMKERATDESNLHGFRLVIGEIDQCLGRSSIDELDTEDLRFWESYIDVDREVGGYRGVWFRLVSMLAAVAN